MRTSNCSVALIMIGPTFAGEFDNVLRTRAYTFIFVLRVSFLFSQTRLERHGMTANALPILLVSSGLRDCTHCLLLTLLPYSRSNSFQLFKKKEICSFQNQSDCNFLEANIVLSILIPDKNLLFVVLDVMYYNKQELILSMLTGQEKYCKCRCTVWPFFTLH